MGRALFRSVLELRTAATRTASASNLVPSLARRSFTSTSPANETATQTASTTTTSTIAQQAESAAATSRSIESFYPKTSSSTSTNPAPLSDSVRQLLPLLGAQPQHYITFHIYGRPYLVQPGDSVRLPFRMPGVVPGDVLRLDRASVIGSRDFTLKGAPYIDERLFECRAVVTGSELEPVRIKIKKKQRTRRAQRVRSQHRYTTIAISDLKIKSVDEVEGH